MQGTLLVATLNGVNRLKKRSLDEIVDAHSEKKGEDSFCKQQLYCLEKMTALYVPFGFLALTFALHENRPSKKTAEKSQGGAKAVRKAKVGQANKYARHIWIPAMGDKDCEANIQVVNWAYSYLTSTRPVLKKKYIEESGYGKWLDSLGEKAKEHTKADSDEKKTPTEKEKASSTGEESGDNR